MAAARNASTLRPFSSSHHSAGKIKLEVVDFSQASFAIDTASNPSAALRHGDGRVSFSTRTLCFVTFVTFCMTRAYQLPVSLRQPSVIALKNPVCLIARSSRQNQSSIIETFRSVSEEKLLGSNCKFTEWAGRFRSKGIYNLHTCEHLTVCVRITWNLRDNCSSNSIDFEWNTFCTLWRSFKNHIKIRPNVTTF